MPTGWNKRCTDAVSRMLVRIVLGRSSFMVEELKFKWNQTVEFTVHELCRTPGDFERILRITYDNIIRHSFEYL